MEKNNKPLRIFDTTLRDGHQSLFATRMRLEDMLPLLEEMDEIGFEAMEVWGGATFDVCHRFLAEDPWERLATFKKHMPKTPLQMLLRGQNLVGYRHYADDVVEAFVEQAAETGIDRFRVFDALNDERNFETSFRTIKKTGKHIQGTISYSLTERRLGGPIYNIDYYLSKAERLVDMGADSLCIKDMAGILSPYDAYELITALKNTIKIPIQLHTHYTSGMASMTYLKAIEAGVDIVDTALAPFALRTSQPAIEPIMVALEGTERDTGLDLVKLLEIGRRLEEVAPKLREFQNTTKMSVIDTGVLMHQVPGGMLSNMVNQLKQAGALDKIDEVYKELPRVRKELGSPPLVTPSSQIVGIQAVQNVLMGRYKMITNQVKDLCYGLYGATPDPLDEEVKKLCLKGYKRGETSITSRPADVLEPELEKAKEASKGLAKDIKDVLIYAIFPTTGEKFLKMKYGLEPIPEECKPKDPADSETKQMGKSAAGAAEVPDVSPVPRTFNVHIEDEHYEVQVEEVKGRQVVSSVKTLPSAPAPAPINNPRPAPVSVEPPPQPASGPAEGETPIRAPLNGMIIEVKVEAGDDIGEGETVIIIEAMKMENHIKSTVSGKVKSIGCKKGDNVDRDQVLLVIG